METTVIDRDGLRPHKDGGRIVNRTRRGPPDARDIGENDGMLHVPPD